MRDSNTSSFNKIRDSQQRAEKFIRMKNYQSSNRSLMKINETGNVTFMNPWNRLRNNKQKLNLTHSKF